MYNILLFILVIYVSLIYVSIFYLPGIIFNNKSLIKYIKDLFYTIQILFINFGNHKIYVAEQINSKINFVNNIQDWSTSICSIEFFKKSIIKNPNLIDIIICNHISSGDAIVLVSYLNYLNITSCNFVAKSILTYIPGVGQVGYFNKDIIINRKWNEDKTQIKKRLDNYDFNGDKQVIIIFPEGTRLTSSKLLEGQEYSKKNNFPIYNKLLVPKTKGINYILKYLSEKNKLGKIWDLSLINSKKTNSIFDLLNSTSQNSYIIARELHIDPKYYNDNEKFKYLFLKIWKTKDDIISNYDKMIYKKITNKINYLHIISIIIIIILSLFFLNNKYGRYYLLFSIVCLYILMIFKLK